jgi:acylpyruvate hydrolase
VHLVCFEQRRAGPGGRGVAGQSSTTAASDHAPELDALEVGSPGKRRLGALLPSGPHAGDVVDLNGAFAVQLAMRDVGAPEAEADSLLSSDPLRFLERFDASLACARSVLEFVKESLGRYDAPDLVRTRSLHPRRSVRLVAPIPKPGKIVAVARNYAAHASELGAAAAPSEPVLFLKATSALAGPEDDIVLPSATTQVDFEGELAVVIGRRARRVAAREALSYVAGYTVANDVSARDFQNQRGQHFIGKSCDSFAPMGPVLVTADEIDDPQDLAITTRVSGETMQSARTKEMIFPVTELIAFVTKLMTLEPGDVILTGTPAGVGMARKPPRWLHDGDVVEIEIERVGRLHNYVRQEKG